MSLGMTYEEFMHGDVRMIGAFLEASKIKTKRERDEANFNSWLLGKYIYEAVGRLAPVLNFGAKKPIPIDYLSEPFSFNDSDKKEEHKENEEEQKRNAENERLKAIWFFKQWAKDTSKQMCK